MEVLYTRLPSGALSSPDSKINKAYCKGNAKTGKELTQAVTKSVSISKTSTYKYYPSCVNLERVILLRVKIFTVIEHWLN